MIVELLTAGVFSLKARVNRQVNAIICYAVAGLVGLGAVIFGLIAAQSWLLTTMSPIAANLIIAAILLVLALIIGAVGSYIANSQPKSEPVAAAAIIAAPMAARVLAKNANFGTIVLGAVLAGGLIIGRKMGKSG